MFLKYITQIAQQSFVLSEGASGVAWRPGGVEVLPGLVRGFNADVWSGNLLRFAGTVLLCRATASG